MKSQNLKLSVNFFKALYSIFYEFPYFKECKIDYDN